MLDGIKSPFQVRVYDRVKILLRHLDHQIILCDSRIIHENINMPELCHHIRDHLATSLKIRHTTLHRHGLSAHLLNLRGYFLSLFL